MHLSTTTSSTSGGTLLAKCENCTSWQRASLGAAGGHNTAIPVHGVCTKGLAPPEGDVRCEQYTMSDWMQQQVISRMLQDDPMALPVPMRHVVEMRKKQLKAAKARKKKQRK